MRHQFFEKVSRPSQRVRLKTDGRLGRISLSFDALWALPPVGQPSIGIFEDHW